jgi:prepilin-type N-terminal cleavage/methylation domain-containing protein
MRTPRNAFTLLEVLLAMALAAVLLALLTSTVAVQLRLLQAGRASVEEAQLGRALLRQMADELRRVVPDPAEGERVGTLVGSREELQFTIRRPLQKSRTTTAADPRSASGYPTVVVPEDRHGVLRIVNYGMGRNPVRLVRCERDYATTAWAVGQGKLDAWLNMGSVVATEVKAIEFVYFRDGLAQEQWDSGRKGRLPSAVKINVTIRRSGRMRNYFTDETAEEQRTSAIYSLMVYLPGPSPAVIPQDSEEQDTPSKPSESPKQ